MPLHLFSLSPKRTMNKWQSEAMLNFRGWQLIDINLEVCYKKRPFLEGGGVVVRVALLPWERGKRSLIAEQFSVVRWLNARTTLSPPLLLTSGFRRMALSLVNVAPA